jgi:hypothetical protein
MANANGQVISNRTVSTANLGNDLTNFEGDCNKENKTSNESGNMQQNDIPDEKQKTV